MFTCVVHTLTLLVNSAIMIVYQILECIFHDVVDLYLAAFWFSKYPLL